MNPFVGGSPFPQHTDSDLDSSAQLYIRNLSLRKQLDHDVADQKIGSKNQ
jgi:hypothetical protein